MWYKIQVGDNTPIKYLDENCNLIRSKNYLFFINGSFQYTDFRSATYFLQDHLVYDDKLKDFLCNKIYRLIECPGFHSFPVYHGQTMKM